MFSLLFHRQNNQIISLPNIINWNIYTFCTYSCRKNIYIIQCVYYKLHFAVYLKFFVKMLKVLTFTFLNRKEKWPNPELQPT